MVYAVQGAIICGYVLFEPTKSMSGSSHVWTRELVHQDHIGTVCLTKIGVFEDKFIN